MIDYDPGGNAAALKEISETLDGVIRGAALSSAFEG
jgi:hypothetical protein